MYKIATIKSNTLCILALIVILICIFAFGFLFQILEFLFKFSGYQIQIPSSSLGILIGGIFGVILALPIVYYEKIKRRMKQHKAKTILEQQTTFICPRCKILVDKNPGICPKCNQKI
ncbi:MAG: hypothetical protein ACFFD5_01980 [Candidatus Thorarchaeota archaeon]